MTLQGLDGKCPKDMGKRQGMLRLWGVSLPSTV